MNEWVHDAAVNWAVAIPSKRRSRNMPRMMAFFPYARVYVDAVEKDDYAPHVPAGQLVLHDSLPNHPHIARHIFERERDSVVLLLDDDLEKVASFVRTYPRMREYSDWRDLRRIVENMVNLLEDLDLMYGGWNCMAHPGGFNPIKPVSLTGVVRGAMMVRGRQLEVDTEITQFDMDLTLQALLKSRVLVKDMRFFWDFGSTQANAGGRQAVDTNAEYITRGRERLRAKWPGYIEIGNLPMSARMHGGVPANVEHFGHRVSRSNPSVKLG
jgi:hypothetical protein